LIKARKNVYSSQREFGKAVADRLQKGKRGKTTHSLSPSYAQKKVSLWESGQLIPGGLELQAIAELLSVQFKELEESFSTGVLPSAASDLIRLLAETQGQGLIASCFAGRVRPKLFSEDEEALREAVEKGVAIAIFFPFTKGWNSIANSEYADALSHQHREAWRSTVKFWRMIRSFSSSPDHSLVRLYRPQVEASNVLFPPMFHRPTLLCERINGRTKVEFYNWAQGPENDGFFKISGRSLEESDVQAESWELFFGEVFEHWTETGELASGDSYWTAYGVQSEDGES
jgi:hypothetical protein